MGQESQDSGNVDAIAESALGYRSVAKMCLMAALEENGKRYEVELAAINWLGNGTVEMRPRILPRRSQAGADCQHWIPFSLPDGSKYEFLLEDGSPDQGPSFLEQQLERMRQIDRKALSLRKNLAGHGFEPVEFSSSDDVAFSLFGEILSFEPNKAGCEADTIVRRPAKHGATLDDWEERCLLRTCDQPSWRAVSSAESYYVLYEFLPSADIVFKGRTRAHVDRRSSTFWASSPAGDAVVFNQPIECHFVRRAPKSDDAAVPCRVLLQIYRKDTWDRHNFLGYSFVDIPTASGEYDINCRLWSPCGTIMEQLGSKFCGAATTLLSSKAVVATDTDKPNRSIPQNRSFLRTQSDAGKLRIHLNVVQQLPAFVAARKGKVPQFRKSTRFRDRQDSVPI